MCRSIKVLRRPEQSVTSEEISAAALQFIRKVSGYRKPSKSNQQAFDAAVQDVADATEKLLRKLKVVDSGRASTPASDGQPTHAG